MEGSAQGQRYDEFNKTPISEVSDVKKIPSLQTYETRSKLVTFAKYLTPSNARWFIASDDRNPGTCSCSTCPRRMVRRRTTPRTERRCTRPKITAGWPSFLAHTVGLMACPATRAVAAIACAHLFIPGCTWTAAAERRGAGPIRFTEASSPGS